MIRLFYFSVRITRRMQAVYFQIPQTAWVQQIKCILLSCSTLAAIWHIYLALLGEEQVTCKIDMPNTDSLMISYNYCMSNVIKVL